MDKVFIEMMIVDHQEAVDMAETRECQACRTLRGRKKNCCPQTKEIQMMKDWLKAWGYKRRYDEGGYVEWIYSQMGIKEEK